MKLWLLMQSGYEIVLATGTARRGEQWPLYHEQAWVSVVEDVAEDSPLRPGRSGDGYRALRNQFSLVMVSRQHIRARSACQFHCDSGLGTSGLPWPK